MNGVESRDWRIRMRRRGESIALALGLTVVFILVPAPMLWLLLNSFKTNVEALAIPPRLIFPPTLENYHAVMVSNPDFSRFYFNSVFTSLVATAVVLILGIPAAYVLARATFRGKVLLAF